MVVFGSGGHTTEMIQILNGLGVDYFQKISFIYSSQDILSKDAALNSFRHKNSKFILIPRARRVGQSYFSSVFTTINAFMTSVSVLVSTSPDIIICNGPAICVPIVIASYIYRILGLEYSSVVYIESFARVKTLSLTGKLLYRLSDKFVVQWPYFKKTYPRSEYYSYLV
ncbi:hypothetical protein BB561_001488 [Smittium simulii]|uniref:UDP-N-acetylglucosamine transferase subunit ALG14 n=1 Tax=Smittium simulii TaxID=133385 RepID=A0A2T9YUB8_9FUNG|nr:hypothetical protein BB561_001488 [Smittium simulii]